MAKITSSGPTNASEPGYFDKPEETEEPAEREGDDVSAGTSSSQSPETKTTLPSPEGTSGLLLVPTTENPSSQGPTESSTASSTAGSGTEGSPQSDVFLSPFGPNPVV